MKKVWKCEFKFEFECPKDWEEMQKTSSETVRFCEVCEKNVYFCINKNELESHRKKGDCIATFDFFLDSINKNEEINEEKPHSRQSYTVNRVGEFSKAISKGRLKS